MAMDNITARLTQAQTQIGTDVQTPAQDIPSLEMELTNTQIAVMAIIEYLKQIVQLLPNQTPPTAPPTGMMGA